MNLYGGLGLGIVSPIAKNAAEPSTVTVGGSSSEGYATPSKESPKSSDGTHMPEYPSTTNVGGYSEGYATPSKESSKADDGTHMPEYPTTVDTGGGYSEGYAQPKKEQDTDPEPEPTPQPQGKLDVSKLLQNQTPPSTFYTDDEGNISNTPNTKGRVYYGENALTPKTTAPKTKAQTATAALPEVSQIYTMDGDDYSFDTNAFAAAQRGTGEDQAAMSIAGGSGGGSKRNSNVNDAVFGGQSNSATPGYSLW